LTVKNVVKTDRPLKLGFDDRVTRLGEFLPIGRLFTLSSFLKIITVALICNCFFPW
jgi:hypothetical protein